MGRAGLAPLSESIGDNPRPMSQDWRIMDMGSIVVVALLCLGAAIAVIIIFPPKKDE